MNVGREQIRVFINSLGLQAFAVYSDDLFSVRILIDENFENNVAYAKARIPSGFVALGTLREKHQVTFRYLREGAFKQELSLPENLSELHFEF